MSELSLIFGAYPRLISDERLGERMNQQGFVVTQTAWIDLEESP
jgi:hypothetical protein